MPAADDRAPGTNRGRSGCGAMDQRPRSWTCGRGCHCFLPAAFARRTTVRPRRFGVLKCRLVERLVSRDLSGIILRGRKVFSVTENLQIPRYASRVRTARTELWFHPCHSICVEGGRRESRSAFSDPISDRRSSANHSKIIATIFASSASITIRQRGRPRFVSLPGTGSPAYPNVSVPNTYPWRNRPSSAARMCSAPP